jgi:hypothetical protein
MKKKIHETTSVGERTQLWAKQPHRAALVQPELEDPVDRHSPSKIIHDAGNPPANYFSCLKVAYPLEGRRHTRGLARGKRTLRSPRNGWLHM